MTATPAPKTRRRMAGVLLAVLALVAVIGILNWAAASRDARERSRMEDGALAAAEVYVAAIASGDYATADAMTDPEQLVTALRNTADVRAALPAATEWITEPWVQAVQATEGGTVAFTISYRIGQLAGGGDLSLRLTGDDPSAVQDWQVAWPLLVHTPVFADAQTVSVVDLAGVEVPLADGYSEIWGYPGTYLATAAEPVQEGTAEPQPITLGARDLASWNDPLPTVGGES